MTGTEHAGGKRPVNRILIASLAQLVAHDLALAFERGRGYGVARGRVRSPSIASIAASLSGVARST